MFIPLGHDTRIQRFPYVTVSIIALNTLIWLVTFVSMLGAGQDLEEKLREIDVRLYQMDPDHYNDNQRLIELLASPEYAHERDDPAFHEMVANLEKDLDQDQKWQIEQMVKEIEDAFTDNMIDRWGFVPANWNPVKMITYAFMHGGWLHLIGNMLFLWIFGTPLEDKWGPYVYTAFYLLGAIAGAVLHGLAALGSSVPMVGASGAIFALCGAFMYRYSKSKVIMGYFFWIGFVMRWGRFNVPAWIVMLFYFLENLVSLYLTPSAGGGVAYGAHIGGFLFGLAVAVGFVSMGIEKKYLKQYDLDGEEHIIPEEFQSALEQIGRKEYDKALVNLQATLAKDPNYLPALSETLKVYATQKNRSGVLDTANRIVEQYLKQNSTEGNASALDVYMGLGKDFPDMSLKPAVQLRVADCLMKQQMFREAAIAHRNLATNNPGGAIAEKALYTCATILTDKLGEHQNAMNVLKYLLKTYPNSHFLEYARPVYERAKKAMSGGLPSTETADGAPSQ